MEHAIEDSYAFHKFVQVDFIGDEQAPDATTLTKFCRPLHENGLAKLGLDMIARFMEKHGRIMHGERLSTLRWAVVLNKMGQFCVEPTWGRVSCL